MNGVYRLPSDKVPIMARWAENDWRAYNQSMFADPYEINLPRACELTWSSHPGAFTNLSERESAKAGVVIMHPLDALIKVHRAREGASASSGGQMLQFEVDKSRKRHDDDRHHRAGPATSDRHKDAAPVIGASKGARLVTAIGGESSDTVLAYRLLTKDRLLNF